MLFQRLFFFALEVFLHKVWIRIYSLVLVNHHWNLDMNTTGNHHFSTKSHLNNNGMFESDLRNSDFSENDFGCFKITPKHAPSVLQFHVSLLQGAQMSQEEFICEWNSNIRIMCIFLQEFRITTHDPSLSALPIISWLLR